MRLVMLLVIAAFIGTPAFAAPPATATEIDLNLLNKDGTNINVSLLLTIDYTDSSNNMQTVDSTSTKVDWEIFDGKSNLYAKIPGKSGTNITITIDDGYEPIDVVANEGAFAIVGTFYLSQLSNPGTDKSEYLEGETVNVTWSATATPQMSNWIMVQFYNENDAATEELFAASPSATSYDGHTVGASELGDIIRVSIYYADGSSDNPGDLGTSDPISTAYTVTAAPEFPFGLAILFVMFIPIYFSMRRRFLDNMA